MTRVSPSAETWVFFTEIYLRQNDEILLQPQGSVAFSEKRRGPLAIPLFRQETCLCLMYVEHLPEPT